MSTDPKILFPILEKTGEPQVRINLSQGLYGERKIPLVQEWLRQQESLHLKEILSQQKQRDSDNIRIACSAKNAAWIAAIAAIIAAIAAIIR